MSEDQPIVASAVVVPEAPQPASPQGALKRRQSSISENDSKRPRLSADGSDQPDGKGDTGSTEDTGEQRTTKRVSGKLEERRRGQRLFGALLGTLSQSSSTASQRRRADIDKKQQDKLKLQDEEFDQKRKERLAKLQARREREQEKYDAQSMRIRHSNLLSMAQFLQTKTEPKLYYKPWELTPEEEEQIKAQTEEALATVDRELEAYEAHRGSRTHSDTERHEEDEKLGPSRPPSGTVGSQVTVAETKPAPEVDSSTNSTAGPHEEAERLERGAVLPGEDSANATSTNGDSNMHAASEGHNSHVDTDKEAVDEHGDVVLETEEDTVIY